jgi:hypothetical protein
MNINPRTLDRLPLIEVVYIPQDLHTYAVQVCNETIGAMAIEFGVEIGIAHPNHKWLPTAFERTNSKGEKIIIERTLNNGDWLVILNDEVIVFPSEPFWSTFASPDAPSHSADVPSNHSVMGFMQLPPDLTHEGKIGDMPISGAGLM